MFPGTGRIPVKVLNTLELYHQIAGTHIQYIATIVFFPASASKLLRVMSILKELTKAGLFQVVFRFLEKSVQDHLVEYLK